MRKTFLAAAFALSVAGCTTTPTAPPELDLPPPTLSDATAAVLPRWWTAFGDPRLDALIDEALANNLDLRAALARIEQARARVTLSQADLFPTADLSVGANRTKATERGTNPIPQGFSPYSNDFIVGLQASYEVDLWGKFRTATRAAQSDLVSTEYGRETVRTMVAADTARLYFNLLAADAQLSLLEDTLKTRNQAVELQLDRNQAGVIGDFDLRTAEAERFSVLGDIAAAKRADVEYESALATILGRSPRAVFSPSIARTVAMSWVDAVPNIPEGIPSNMLARRPDIRQSEAALAAANMRIDVARADYFPAVSLTGLFGTEAGALRALFSGPALVWSIGASLAQPLIGLKAIEANVAERTALRDELIVNYTKTVQSAFHDAHDALSANETTRAGLAAQSERATRLSQALELADLRYRAGYSPYLDVLDAQRQLLQAQTLQIIAARNVRLAVVDIAKALGGGWDYENAVVPPTGLIGMGSGAVNK